MERGRHGNKLKMGMGGGAPWRANHWLRGKKESEAGTEWEREIIKEGECGKDNHDERRQRKTEIIIPLSTYSVRCWLVEWPLGQPSLGAISNRMTDGENIVQRRPKEFGWWDGVPAHLWTTLSLISETAGQDQKCFWVCYVQSLFSNMKKL